MVELDIALKFPYQNKPRLIVDAGAHVGGFAAPFINAGWRAICIEPETENWIALRDKFGSNPRVKLHKVAVGKEKGTFPFYVSPDHWGIHSMQPWHETHKPAGVIDVTLLAYIVHEPVSLLRLNIEGSELPALQGYDLKKFPPELALVEFYDSRTEKHFGYNHHDLVSYMKPYGYVAYISEWAEVQEYSRKDRKTILHKHLGIRKYPLDHAPAWGNLIFIKADRAKELERLIK
jgi:FkbM family methyltransferase